MAAKRWGRGLPRLSEYSGSTGLTSEENAKKKKETKATRFCLTPPHISQYENLYKQHTGTPRGQPVPSTHRTYPRSGHEDLARFFLQVVLGFFFFPKKIKKTSWIPTKNSFFFFFFFVTQVSSGLWQKNLYELIYFRPFVHLKKLSLKSHSEINIFFQIIYTKWLNLLSFILIRSRRVLETFHFKVNCEQDLVTWSHKSAFLLLSWSSFFSLT